MPQEEAREMKFHERLRFLRKHRKKTLAELADYTGLSISHLSGVERGEAMPSLDACIRLANVYGMSLSLLFSGVEHDRNA